MGKKNPAPTHSTLEKDDTSYPFDPAPLRFDESPLNVRILPAVKEKDKRHWIKRYWYWFVIGPLFLVVLLLWFVMFLPQSTANNLFASHPELNKRIDVGFSAPKNVFISEESNIDVTIANISNTSFNGNITLAFAPGTPLTILPYPESNSSFAVNDLKPGASFSRQIRFILNKKNGENRLKFSIKAIYADNVTDNTKSAQTGTQYLNIFSFSFLHRPVKLLLNMGIISILFGLLIEFLKNRFK